MHLASNKCKCKYKYKYKRMFKIKCKYEYKCQHEAFVSRSVLVWQQESTWLTNEIISAVDWNYEPSNDCWKPPYAGVCPNAVDPVTFCGATTHTERSHKNLNLKDFHITLIMMLMILSSNDNNDNDLFVCQGLADGEPEMDFSGLSFHPFPWTRHQSNLVQHIILVS